MSLLFVALGCAFAKDELPTGVTRLRPALDAPVVDLAISPNGFVLAAVTNPVADSPSPTGSLALWDLRSKQQLASRQFPTGVSRVLFLADNALIVGLIDGSLQRVDAASLETTAKLGSPHGAVTSLALSIDAKEVLAGHVSGVIQRARDDDLTLHNELPAAARSPIVAILPRGKADAFYFVCWNGHWGAHGLPEDADPQGKISGRLEPVIHDAVLLQTERVLATAGPGTAVTLVDLSTGKTEQRLQTAHEIVGIATGTPGEIWTINRGSAVQRWSHKDGKLEDTWQLKGSLHSLAISPERWCVGDDRGHVHLGPLETDSER